MTRFDLRTQEEVVDSLAQSFPCGRLFQAVGIEGSNLRRLLEGLAVEVGRIERLLTDDIYEQYFLNEGQDGLVETWEKIVGIPDDCFSNLDKTRVERVEQVLTKLRAREVVTEQDFIDLARTLGYTVTIDQGIEVGAFPLILPFILGSPTTLRFTMIMNLPVSLAPTSVFPMTLPFTLSSGGGSVVECFFNKLVPANVTVIYNYVL
jgi:uncharacterized protein YmfQ (DUF2313 family)